MGTSCIAYPFSKEVPGTSQKITGPFEGSRDDFENHCRTRKGMDRIDEVALDSTRKRKRIGKKGVENIG